MKVCTRVSVRWQQIVSVSFEFWGLLKKKAPQTLCSQSFRQAHFCKDGRKTDVFWTKIGALNGRKDGRISQIDGQNHKNTGIRRATFHKHSSRRARLSKDGYLWNTADANFRLLGLYQARTSPWNQQLRQPWLGNQKNLGGPKGCYCILVPPKFLFYRSSSVYDPPKSFFCRSNSIYGVPQTIVCPLKCHIYRVPQKKLPFAASSPGTKFKRRSPVLKSVTHGTHGWGHIAVWGGTFGR